MREMKKVRSRAIQRFLSGESGLGGDLDGCCPTYYVRSEGSIYRTTVEPKMKRLPRFREDPSEVPTDGIRATSPVPVPFVGY